jgi:hypothetical protein
VSSFLYYISCILTVGPLFFGILRSWYMEIICPESFWSNQKPHLIRKMEIKAAYLYLLQCATSRYLQDQMNLMQEHISCCVLPIVSARSGQGVHSIHDCYTHFAPKFWLRLCPSSAVLPPRKNDGLPIIAWHPDADVIAAC